MVWNRDWDNQSQSLILKKDLSYDLTYDLGFRIDGYCGSSLSESWIYQLSINDLITIRDQLNAIINNHVDGIVASVPRVSSKKE